MMNIPKHVENIIKELEKRGYEAWIVGGCVRDLLLGKKPGDWDITTNAEPKKILEVFPDGKYENSFGTVILPLKDGKDKLIDILEITTYRSERGYSDRRRPDEVKFEKELDKDLSRRDFTINALAARRKKSKLEIKEDLIRYAAKKNDFVIIDLFGGLKDLDKRIIRAVGEPMDRFKEDALRMMRAIRLAGQLNFSLEPKTSRAIVKMAGAIKFVARERIAAELIKILESNNPYDGIKKLQETKLLGYILPELLLGIGVSQDRHHIYSVFEHSLLSLKYCPNNDWRVRFAALLHDVAKPKTKVIREGIATFYNHEYVGARMVKQICRRLKFSLEDMKKITTLVRAHMFYYNVGEVTAASVRRLIKKTGRENLKDLIDLRIADRLGSGTPKAMPYKLRHLQYMMKKVQNDPISVKMLKVDGNDLIKILKIKPGPRIGAILDILLSEVIANPKLNNKKYLGERAMALNELDAAGLRNKAREVICEKREEDDKEMKKEFRVK